MKLWDIVKNVGSSIVREAVPGGGLLLSTINEFLPDDKKLPSGATGSDVESAINSLPSDKRAELLNREFDVDIKRIEANAALMTSAPAHVTRAFIAKWSFVFLAVFSGFVGGIIISAYFYAVYKQDVNLVKQIVDGWPFVLAILCAVTGTFSILVKAYFGILRKEQQDRLNAANGSTTGGLSSIIANMVKR